MDLFHLYKLKEIQWIIEELGLEDETSSHTTPQGQTSEGERKSHIPSVTTVSGARGALHGDRQARRTSAAEQDGNEAPPRTSPVMAAPSADAHAKGRAHRPPNNTICRIICRLPRFSSTNCARRSLHWLPVKQRLQFKKPFTYI